MTGRSPGLLLLVRIEEVDIEHLLEEILRKVGLHPVEHAVLLEDVDIQILIAAGGRRFVIQHVADGLELDRVGRGGLFFFLLGAGGRAEEQQQRQQDCQQCFMMKSPAEAVYSMFRMSAKPVTSKISMIISLAWITFMVPCLFMVFWADRSTRKPAEEM